ncbi:MAG: hypothetical protein AAF645_10915 [Myxococcota bacterium]
MTFFDKQWLDSELLRGLRNDPCGRRYSYLVHLFCSTVGPRTAVRSCLHLLGPIDLWLQDTFAFAIRSYPTYEERGAALEKIFGPASAAPNYLGPYEEAWDFLGETAHEWEHPSGRDLAYISMALRRSLECSRRWLQTIHDESLHEAHGNAIDRLEEAVLIHGDVPWEWQSFHPYKEMGIERTLGSVYLREFKGKLRLP